MLGPNDLPFAVAGERCLILEKPPKEKTEGGLYLPDVAKERYYSGRLIDAGLKARDKLRDNGFRIGDDVEFGRYMGLREVWDHVTEGDHTLPDDAYEWRQYDNTGVGTVRRYKCAKTGAIRAIESIIVLNVDDLLASVQLAERIRRREVVVKLGQNADGSTCHYIEHVAEEREKEHRRALRAIEFPNGPSATDTTLDNGRAS